MSNRLSKLINRFENHISVPWNPYVSAEERAIFVVYHKEDELKLRHRISEFELACTQHGHGWQLLDIATGFAEWMADQDYKDAYFKNPEFLESKYSYFAEDLAENIKAAFKDKQDENSVVALIGCSSLFGFTSVSGLVKEISKEIQGRIVIFFPGEHYENTYRLLDARDGWGYQATAITVAQ